MHSSIDAHFEVSSQYTFTPYKHHRTRLQTRARHRGGQCHQQKHPQEVKTHALQSESFEQCSLGTERSNPPAPSFVSS